MLAHIAFFVGGYAFLSIELPEWSMWIKILVLLTIRILVELRDEWKKYRVGIEG